MIKIIINAGPDGQRPGWIEEEYPEDLQEKVAGDILTAIEEAGILPPQRDADLRSSYGYAQIWEWSKEDEKK